MGRQKTHTLEDGRYRQIVSPEELRRQLDEDGDDYSRPDYMNDEDEWDTGTTRTA
jgi:hypothetical protein